MAVGSTDRSVVVVTGASSGVGRATAEAFAARGARVVVSARSRPALEEVALACERAGGRALVVPADVAEPEEVDGLLRQAVDAHGRVDVWVNNASVECYGRLEEIPLDDLRRVIDVNLLGYAHGARAVIPQFRRQGEGVLVNVGSILGRMGGAFQAPYVMSKFGVRGLTQTLRQEVADLPDVAVCLIQPGPVDTPLFQRAANHTHRQVEAPGPPDDPDDVAQAIVACAQRPRREVIVGLRNRLGVWTYEALPSIGERLSARVMNRVQFGDEPVEPHAGNLHAPDDRHAKRGGWQEGTEGAAGTAVRVAGAVAALGLLGAVGRRVLRG